MLTDSIKSSTESSITPPNTLINKKFGDVSSLSVGCDRILYIRLPCNPIFPIGVVYLSDHVHKVAPDVQQNIFDLGTVPRSTSFNQTY